MSESGSPDKQPRSLLKRLRKLDSPEVEIPTFSQEETLEPEIREKIDACVDKWRELLRWKTPIQAKALGSPSFVRLLSVIEPPEEARAKLQPWETRRMKSTGFTSLATALSEFARNDDIVPYSPKHVHAILYDEQYSDILFPGSDSSEFGGFHRSFAGHPAIFWPLEKRPDGEYGLSPSTLGHEFGEVVVSEIERRAGTSVHGRGASQHFLKEGLCDVVGHRFHQYAGTKIKGLQNGSYENLYMRKPIVELEILFTEEFAELPKQEYKFAEYHLAGSLVSALSEKYGLKHVLDYFMAEADAAVRREEKLRERLKRFEKKPDVSVDFGFDEKGVHVPPQKNLDNLLMELGYTRADFEGKTSLSEPFDMRPEGSIAASIYAECAEAISEHESRRDSHRASEVQSGERQKGPTFIDRAIRSLDTMQAKEIFGDDFSAHDFVMSWRGRILSLGK